MSALLPKADIVHGRGTVRLPKADIRRLRLALPPHSDCRATSRSPSTPNVYRPSTATRSLVGPIASLIERRLLLLLRLAYGRGTHATPHVAGREVPNHLAVIGASHDGPPASLVGLIHADLTHAARLLFGFV